MFDQSLIESYPEDIQDQIIQAISTLAATGILERQVKLQTERLTDGDASEDLKELAKKILRHRAETQGLILIHNFGLQLLKETEDAQES